MRAQHQKIKLLKEGGASEDDIIGERCRYRKTMDDYVKFSKTMGIPQQRARIYVDGAGSVGVGKLKKSVTETQKDGIILGQ